MPVAGCTRRYGIICAMRKLFLFAGLLVILTLILVLNRTRPDAPPQPAAFPVEAQTELQSDSLTTRQPADQLIVASVGADATAASNAYRDLERIGYCPYLLDSPESPVGLAGAAYDLHGNDTSRIRDTIRLLVKLGCDIDQYSAVGLTPLHGAIIGRQPDLLGFLLEQGADPKLRVIPIPGSQLGRSIAHHDAYGMTLVLREKYPDDTALREILKLLQPGA